MHRCAERRRFAAEHNPCANDTDGASAKYCRDPPARESGIDELFSCHAFADGTVEDISFTFVIENIGAGLVDFGSRDQTDQGFHVVVGLDEMIGQII